MMSNDSSFWGDWSVGENNESKQEIGENRFFDLFKIEISFVYFVSKITKERGK